MALESIEKLREQAMLEEWSEYKRSQLREFADEVEREIFKKYMKLPVDADGVPIHLNDKLILDEETFYVCAVGNALVWFNPNGCDKDYGEFISVWASCCHHVNFDPVKELLEEFGNTVSKQDVDFDMLDAVDEYATKLREAVKQ